MFNCLRKILLVFLLSLTTQLSFAYTIIESDKGKVDLSSINFEEDYVRLSGNWEFYFEQLLSPKDLDAISSENKSFGEIPMFWKHYGNGLPKFGYATYKLSFELDKSQLDTPLSIRVANIHNAYKVWFNGVVISEVGTVGRSYEESVPRWLPLYAELDGLDLHNELVIQVCNFRHRNGGIQDPVEMGKSSFFNAEYRHQFFSEVFLAGSAFVLGCFFFGMFLFWKKDRAALFFAFFSIAFCIRIILVGTRSVGYTFPILSWDVLIRTEYIVMFAMHYFMFQFVYNGFKMQTSRNYLTILKIVTTVLVLICLIPGDYFTYLTIPNNYYLLITFIYTVYIFIQGLRADVPGAIWAILAMAIFFFTTIPMILEYSNLFIPDPVFLNVCYIAFMLSMSLVFASRFGYSFSYLENLKNSEEEKSKEILRQKESIEKSNILINESINYAERIQKSLLPTDIDLRNAFGDCFVFFRPEGKVSGDFYWSKNLKKEEEAMIAIGDCTGHGVPGAFISLIAISALDNIINTKDTVRTDSLLTDLNDIIHDRLQKEQEYGTVIKEGLDISVCRVNLKERKLWFSAAHHKMLVVKRSGEYEVYAGDSHHIGMPLAFDEKFTRHELQLDEGDQIYLFTDGIYDQKGGDEGKKLYLKRLVNKIVSNRELAPHRQKLEFESFIENWMKEKPQMDDMLLFGLKF